MKQLFTDLNAIIQHNKTITTHSQLNEAYNKDVVKKIAKKHHKCKSTEQQR